MLVSDLIALALRDIGSLAQGETPNTDEQNDAFATLNQILSSWSLDGNIVYNQKNENFAITAGTDTYTMGVGGTWNTTARPVRVIGAVAQSGAFQSGCEVMGMSEFMASIKDGIGTTAVLPVKVGVDHKAPLLTIRVWPVPSAIASMKVYSWQPLTAFASVADQINFPVPGLDLALRLELAVTLAHSWGMTVPQELAANYARAMQRVTKTSQEAEAGATPGAAQQPKQ